ncbi:hypothetical protein TNCV_5097831 [Trichonephila clavipes]|nr:hypothetical protein TNCV_5097831 [Trichonephila clavipes]
MHSPHSLFGFDFVVFEGGEQKPSVERANDKLAGKYNGSADMCLLPLRSQRLVSLLSLPLSSESLPSASLRSHLEENAKGGLQ